MEEEEETHDDVFDRQAELLALRASSDNLEKLESFKQWMHTIFKQHCIQEYGQNVFNKYIYPYYDDFMECVEYNLEDLAEQALQDEEFLFDLENRDY